MSTTRKNNLAQSLQHAMTLWARGDQDAALAITQALFDDAPANEQLALNHSGLLLHKQNFAAAMACLERHQTHAALSPALLANLAIAYAAWINTTAPLKPAHKRSKPRRRKSQRGMLGGWP